MRYFRVRNWEKRQHYKDRKPPWIKLHRDLLSDPEYRRLSVASRAHLPLVWLLAAERDNRLPFDPEYIREELRAREPVDLDELVSAGFIELCEVEGKVDHDASTEQVATQTSEKWASRYVSAAQRAEVLGRAGQKCENCGAADNLEIDHKVPISRGGTGDTDNLQVLCRRCNRSKRTRLAHEWKSRSNSAEQVATQSYADSQSVLPREQSTENREQRPETRKSKTPASPPRADAARAPESSPEVEGATDAPPERPKFDLRPYVDAWREATGGSDLPWGAAGKVLKRRELAAGPEETMRRWRRYAALVLAEAGLSYASPSGFDKRWPELAQPASPAGGAADPGADPDGGFTPDAGAAWLLALRFARAVPFRFRKPEEVQAWASANPAVWAAVREVGGFPALVNLEERNEPFTRRRFEAKYLAVQTKTHMRLTA